MFIEIKTAKTIQHIIQYWLRTSLTEWLKAKGLKIDPPKDISLSPPRYEQFGDYSTNIAMQFAKVLHTAPLQIANDITDYLNTKTDKPNIIDNIQVAPPGFINIYLAPLKIIETLMNLKPIKDHSIKIIVEHTSVNPNKALHIGHLRNAVLGDTIQRLLKLFFSNIEVQNYIDDTGVQVADTVAALELFGPPKDNTQPFDDYCWDIYSKYHRLLKEESAKYAPKRQEIVHDIEHFGEYFNKAQELTNQILDHHLNELSKYGITYDLLIYESHIIYFRLWDYAFKLLKDKGLIQYFKDGKWAGCWVFTGNGLNKILVRSNGTKVYTAKDIAYHLWKTGALKEFDFLYKPWQGNLYRNPKLYQTATDGHKLPNKFGNADKVINVIDARQSYPQQVVKLAVETVLNKTNVIKHIPYGVVALSRKTAELLGIDTSDNRSIYHMSGRKGIGIKSKEFFAKIIQRVEKKAQTNKQDLTPKQIEKIALAALRYYLLKYTVERDIVFDIDEAINIHGKTGPYLQYSYVRALNILKKSKLINASESLPLSSKTIDTVIEQLNNTYNNDMEINEHEKRLIRLLSKLNDVFVASTQTLEPAILADYAHDIASAFNVFYEHTPVLKENNQSLMYFRLILVLIFVKHFQTILDILGIPLIDRM